MFAKNRFPFDVKYIAVICNIVVASTCVMSSLVAADSADKPAPMPTVIDAADKSAIEAAMPHAVTVAGTVSEIKGNDNAVTINFNGTENSRFYAVVLKRNRDVVENVYGQRLKSLAGKRVQISGKIVEYRQTPEIVVSSPDQIVVVDESKSVESKSPDSDAAEIPTRRPDIIDATDKAAIRGAMPKEAIVAGTISEIKNTGDVASLEFKGTEKSQFNAVILKRNREALEKVFGEGMKMLDGRHVHVTGLVVEYHAKPQIVIARPEQVVILEK